MSVFGVFTNVTFTIKLRVELLEIIIPLQAYLKQIFSLNLPCVMVVGGQTTIRTF